MEGFGLVLVLIGCLVSAVGWIMVLIKAFEESVLWGIASLFIPFVLLIFAIMNWDEARSGFLIAVSGTAVMILGQILAAAFGTEVMTPTEF